MTKNGEDLSNVAKLPLHLLNVWTKLCIDCFFPSFLCFKSVLHDTINTMILWTWLRCLFNFSGLGPLSFSSIKKCLQSSLTISLQATSFRHFLHPLHSWTWCFFNSSSHLFNDRLVALNSVQSSHLRVWICKKGQNPE